MGKREEFTYESRDQITKIHAVKWFPETEPPRAVVQIIHGMTEYALRYDGFARYLVKQGFLVVANDHLGHDLSRREEEPFGYFCKRDAATVLVRDVHRLKKIVQQEYPGVPFLLIGHSMGSFILRNYLFRYGTGIDGAVIMGTGSPDKKVIQVGQRFVRGMTALRGARYVSEWVNRLMFGSYNQRFDPVRTESDWLSRDKSVVDDYLSDPLCRFRFTLNGYAGLLELIRRAEQDENLEAIPKELPLLLLSGEEDPVGDYGKGVRKVWEAFQEHGLAAEMKLYPEARHEILNELDRSRVWEDIVAWLEKVLAVKEKTEE